MNFHHRTHHTTAELLCMAVQHKASPFIGRGDGTVRLETLIELEFINSSFSSLSSH